MRLEVEKVDYIHEPTDLQCGQAVLAMVTGLTVRQVVEEGIRRAYSDHEQRGAPSALFAQL